MSNQIVAVLTIEDYEGAYLRIRVSPCSKNHLYNMSLLANAHSHFSTELCEEGMPDFYINPNEEVFHDLFVGNYADHVKAALHFLQANHYNPVYPCSDWNANDLRQKPDLIVINLFKTGEMIDYGYDQLGIFLKDEIVVTADYSQNRLALEVHMFGNCHCQRTLQQVLNTYSRLFHDFNSDFQYHYIVDHRFLVFEFEGVYSHQIDKVYNILHSVSDNIRTSMSGDYNGPEIGLYPTRLEEESDNDVPDGGGAGFIKFHFAPFAK
jgi:hypothetical protein